jgi:tetratricopeptide (TPR) repeat protein
MPRSLSIFFSLSFLSLAFVGVGFGLAFRLSPEHRRKQDLRWFASWSVKGLILPLLFWLLINLGLSWDLQAFMPQIQASQNNGGKWVRIYLKYAGMGFYLISTYWAMLTLGWRLVYAGKGLKGETRSDFRALCLTCLAGMALPAGGTLYLGGWSAFGLAGCMLLVPIAGYAPAILKTQKMPPMYARAVAKMKFGKYTEAEWEIIRELEKSEDDFEGWLMLAELYATQFRDLSEAEQTILEICDQPRTNPSQMAVALHRLADWQLKLAEDPDAARRCLQIICDRLPGSHLAKMAVLRMNQLPLTQQELRVQQRHDPIPLPALGDTMDEELPPERSVMDRQEAVQLANACVERLKRDPNNVTAREKFARLLAERLNKADEGIEQLTLLLNMPEQPTEKRAEWLGMIAAWHIKLREDPETGRHLLERVIREFPESPQAIAAARRLRVMDVEYRG